MNERREPTISAYSPSKEEMARQPSKTNTTTRATQARPSAALSPAARPVAPTTKSPLAAIALLLALVATGAAAFGYWQLMEAQKLLVSADIRIASLESKFELSGDETTASAATMQAKLKWADSEIRKLWGVSFDVNRTAISINKTAITKASKLARSAKSGVAAEIKKQTQGLGGEISLVSELVDAQQDSMIAIEKQNAKIVTASQTLTDKLNILDSNRKQLEKRIKTNEQAIEAIDAFRRNVNQQLLQLRGG